MVAERAQSERLTQLGYAAATAAPATNSPVKGAKPTEATPATVLMAPKLPAISDGRPAASIGQAEFGDLMRRRDSTTVRLSVVRDDRARSVVLTLEELLH